MKNFRCVVAAAALVLTCTLPKAAQHDVSEVAEAILPTPLVAEYTCGLYMEALMRPEFVGRWSRELQKSSNRQLAVQEALTEYSGLMRSFCRAIQDAFKGKEHVVSETYGWQIPSFDGRAPALEDREVMAWLKRENVFLQRAIALHEIYEVAGLLAPDLIAPRGSIRVTDEEFHEVRRISGGLLANREREDLIILLQDTGFSLVVPKEFDLDAWRNEEKASRAEARRFGFRLSGFNGTANDLTRHEVQRVVSKEILERYRMFFASPPEGPDQP